MKTLFPEPETITQARRQANIIARALTLRDDGYTIRQRSRLSLFAFFKPGNTSRRADYVVDMTPGHEWCTCKGFINDGDCKHRLAIEVEEEEIEALYQAWGGDLRAWIENHIDKL